MKFLIHLFVMGTYYLIRLRLLPHYIVFLLKNPIFQKDFIEWKHSVFRESDSDLSVFFYMMDELPEYRTVFYYRLGFDSRAISWIAPAERTLHITCQEIGEGIFINHGHSTQINAKKIGKHFQIWHNVTIGVKTQFDNDSRPTIGDNVRICSGACVCGNITIGNNVTIGANSVVMKSVPENCVVVGNPAIIISRNGQKCKEVL